MSRRRLPWPREEPALNPVMVKELRQVVRSRFMVSILLLFLVVLLFAVGGFAIMNSLYQAIDATASPDAGRSLFLILMPILNGACMLCVPLYVGLRLAAERSDTHVDLLFTTAIGPGTIIRGKLFSGIIVAFLLYSLCLPFLAFTYLLRGIDLPTIFFVVGLTFLLNVAAIQAGIFFGAIPASKVFKSLLGMAFFGGTCLLVGLAATLTTEILRSGFGGLLTTAAFWGTVATVLAGGGAAIALLHVLSLALIMPPSANRALPIRAALSGIWLAGAAASAAWARAAGAREVFLPWLAASAIGCAAVLAMAVSEREQCGPRVLRTIPRARLLRALVFPFYSGAAGGVAWVLGTAFLTFFTALVLLPRGVRPSHTLATTANGFLVFFLYVYDYAMTAAWVRATFLAHVMPRRGTWVLMLLLIAAGATLPALGVFLARGHGELTFREWQYGNVFAATDSVRHTSHLAVTGVWAALITILNARWLARQARGFRPPSARAPAAAPPEEPREARTA